MKAAVCYEFGKPLVVEDVVMDDKIKKNEVKVRLAATAICHSDIHEWRGDMGGELPFIGGHESSGYIEEVGASVKNVKPGDPVVASVMDPCGECPNCLKGLPHICLATPPFFPTFYRARNKKGQKLRQSTKTGTFAEYTIVDQAQVVKIPGDIPMASAALLGCGFITGFGAAVNRAQIKALHSVVVIGTGGVGLSAIQGAAISGGYPIIAVDLLDNKLKAALKFGATHTVNAKATDAVEAVKKLTAGLGVEYALVTVGNVAAVRQGFAMLAPRGLEVIVGMPPAADMVSLSPNEFIGTEKVLTGCAMGATRLSTDVPRLIDLYKAGKIKLDEMITARYPLEKINEAIDSVEKGKALRNVIVF